MKMGALKKLRSRWLRRREEKRRTLMAEPSSPLNFFRKRIEGQVEALDGVLDDVDRQLKSQHDRRHDRRKRCSG
jgi:hypothetical protein